MKSIKIVITDDKKGKIEIPITIELIREWYDMPLAIDRFDINPRLDTKPIVLFRRIMGMVIDANDEGKCYLVYNKQIKEDNRKEYHVGKPRWEKI